MSSIELFPDMNQKVRMNTIATKEHEFHAL